LQKRRIDIDSVHRKSLMLHPGQNERCEALVGFGVGTLTVGACGPGVETGAGEIVGELPEQGSFP
jgi:hypothetical protein